MNTALWGGRRAIYPLGTYEQVMPLDIIATALLKAVVRGDTEQAKALDRRARLKAARQARRENLERPAKAQEKDASGEPPPSAPPARAGGGEWKAGLFDALAVCRNEPFFSRVMCVEKARWKYCPGHWGTIEECPGKNPGS